MNDKAKRYIGLARRGRMAVSGVSAVRDAVRTGSARLVILSLGASENTLKRVRGACAHYGARIFETDMSQAELGGAVGADTAAAVAITDAGLADVIFESLQQI